MAFDDWMGQVLCDLSPFLEDSGFGHVRALAGSLRNGDGSRGGDVIDLAQAAARRGASSTGGPAAVAPR